MKNTNRILMTAILLVMFFAVSCKKDSSGDNNPAVTGDVTATNLVVSPNVFVINDSLMDLVSGSYELEQGIYKYYCRGVIPTIGVNAVIIDSTDGGYVRKVTGSSTGGNFITLQTTQARLSDIFQEGELSFTLDPGPSSNLKSASGEKKLVYKEISEDYSPGVTSTNKVDYAMDAQVAADVTLKGSFHAEPRVHFDFIFSKARGVQKFSCSLDQTKLILQATAELNLSGSAGYSISYELCKLERRAMFFIYGIPVVMDMELLMTANGYLNFKEAANFPISFTNTSTLNYGITFENGQATMNTGFNNKSELGGTPSFTAEGQLHLDVVPQVTIEFYNVLSNVIKPKPYVEANAKYTNTGGTQEMCAEVDGGIDLGLGVSAALFGDTLFNKTKDFSLLKEVLWKSIEGCEIEKVTLSNAGFGPGSNSCSEGSTPYAVSMHVDDPGHQLGPGVILHALYTFHVPGGGGNYGTISRNWEDMTLQGNTLSYNICIHWVEADYVEQYIYLEMPDGTLTNVVSVVIPGLSGSRGDKSGQGQQSVR